MSVRLSVCMITKNEEEFLSRSLASVREIADEIIVADTGSDDDTVLIARQYGAKVYPVKWRGSFSAARNFSISKATGDWILLLDADEVLERADIPKLLDLMGSTGADGCNFTVLNYMGREESGLYTLHNAFRLLRNNGLYRFAGAIHEQIGRKDGQPAASGTFVNTDIRLHHYGYLEDVVRRKEKRKRNLPLLQKELKADPENPFLIFNLANDYMACSEHEKALALFDKAYARMDTAQAYAPHLVYRRAVTLYTLGRYAPAEKAAQEGLALYPACADLEFLLGTIYGEWGHYTLAIDSFNRCLSMPKPPAMFSFMQDTTTLRPLLALGDLYFRLGDYARAFEHYAKIIEADSSRCGTLYAIGRTLNRLYGDKETVVKKLASFFSSTDYVPNLILLTDILIRERLYTYAAFYCEKAAQDGDYQADACFLKAKLCFFNRQYLPARREFESLLQGGVVKGRVLQNIACKSAQYLFTLSLIEGREDLAEDLARIRLRCDGLTQRVYTQARHLWLSSDETAFSADENWQAVLEEICKLFDRVLRTGEFDLFERLLYLLNRVDSSAVLVALAQVYLDNGYPKLAREQVLRSVKELDYIDHTGLSILAQTMGARSSPKG